MRDLYPFVFDSPIKEYIWGGSRLKALTGKNVTAPRVAEIWEISSHPDGMSIVANGSLAGLSLQELQERLGVRLLGRCYDASANQNRFPLLVKLLDSAASLSVQVHPDDSYAAEHEEGELGKSEMWIVLQADPSSELILGLSQPISPTLFAEAITSSSLEPYLHRIPVKAGDFLRVPAGSLHAILDGITLIEVQQSSNATYRVYDWGRDLSDRPLHIDKALEVIDFGLIAPDLPKPEHVQRDASSSTERLWSNRHFVVERICIAEGSSRNFDCIGDSFEIWGSTDHPFTINWSGGSLSVEPLRFVLLPANLGSVSISTGLESSFIRTRLPQCDNFEPSQRAQ